MSTKHWSMFHRLACDKLTDNLKGLHTSHMCHTNSWQQLPNRHCMSFWHSWCKTSTHLQRPCQAPPPPRYFTATSQPGQCLWQKRPRYVWLTASRAILAALTQLAAPSHSATRHHATLCGTPPATSLQQASLPCGRYNLQAALQCKLSVATRL